MTNTLNTPVEVLEHVYPVRVHRYAVRRASGGRGKFRGGDGIIREIEMLAGAQVAVLSDRRKIPPYGLSGGSPGMVGKTEIIGGGRARRLPSKCSFYAAAGTVVRIETPGGGGWGVGRQPKPETRCRVGLQADTVDASTCPPEGGRYIHQNQAKRITRGEAEKEKAPKQSRLEAFHERNCKPRTLRLRISPMAKAFAAELSQET